MIYLGVIFALLIFGQFALSGAWVWLNFRSGKCACAHTYRRLGITKNVVMWLWLASLVLMAVVISLMSL